MQTELRFFSCLWLGVVQQVVVAWWNQAIWSGSGARLRYERQSRQSPNRVSVGQTKGLACEPSSRCKMPGGEQKIERSAAVSKTSRSNVLLQRHSRILSALYQPRCCDWHQPSRVQSVHQGLPCLAFSAYIQT